MSMPVCEVCGIGLKHGIVLHRSAPKGGDPHWRCEVHMPTPVDPEVCFVEDILERDNLGLDQYPSPEAGRDDAAIAAAGEKT